jgi:hypothetical protein
MSFLDFLNPHAGSNDPQAVPPEAAPAAPSVPAAQAQEEQFDPALIIRMSKAMSEQRAKADAKKIPIPVMHDPEGRKLGPTGVLLALQRDLRLARSAGDAAEIERIQSLLPDVERAVEAFVKKSGLSRDQLFPDPTRTVPLDQQAARVEIARLKQRRDELQAEADKPGTHVVTRFKRLLEARSLEGQAALVASQAGLIQKRELSDAGFYGVWTLVDRKPDKAQQQSDKQGQADQQMENDSERDRA